MDANQLRRDFTNYFVERGHTPVPSAGLIPHDSTLLFTNSGMVQFVPYFTGDEKPAYSRATTIQKCVRAGGKHNDLDDVGRTLRHLTFFEMLGNFSFGDYFKSDAIPWAWGLVTEVFGFDPELLWVTVHVSDDEAADIWHDVVGVPVERIQRFDSDNFWQMGDTGPCGPSSEIFIDKGAAFGEGGGPLYGGDERFMEIWNLVFMQFERRADGTQVALPKPSIDTGAGLERILCAKQGVESVYDTDVMRPIVEAMASVTGKRYGGSFDRSERTDFALRVLAEHARSMTFLVNDGVLPSNEDRGYVLRRIIRRAVRQGFALGVESALTPTMVDSCIEVMGQAYPELLVNRDRITETAVREEERFRQTLKRGLGILDEAMTSSKTVAGATAFELHDTFGFPIELTTEIAEERGAAVDREGFDSAMAEQRARARAANKVETSTDVEAAGAAYRNVLDEHGQTSFTGYDTAVGDGVVLAVIPAGTDESGASLVEIFVDVTPFYAEGGGQVGDTGTIAGPNGTADVLDTTYAVPGLRRHSARISQGAIAVSETVCLSVDAVRRDAVRRNHTGTHILHWALREVLGDHVRQQGSLVAPDRLRFDFAHHQAVTTEELQTVEDLANAEILSNLPVEADEVEKAEAEQMGAIAFFGDKYGDRVRVLHAGGNSLEFCGGTHVSALGDIGTVKIVSEGSIGSGIRRIEAVTGFASLAHIRHEEDVLAQAAAMLRTKPDDLTEAIERALARQKALEGELSEARSRLARASAGALLEGAVDGVVAARVDELAPDQLRDLALALRDLGAKAVALVGSPDGARAAVAVVTTESVSIAAQDVIKAVGPLIGGGGGGKDPRLAQAGGKDITKLDDAVNAARSVLLGR